MMARYDRLAPLLAPVREQALPCWPVLSDLEHCERDADEARRARLRFLALRPVHRLATRGIDAIAADSFERQIERVREELGQLPARDSERAVLARFLNELRTLDPETVVLATLQVSEFYEANGCLGAAEEYSQWALALARAVQRDRLSAASMRALARVALAAGRTAEAEQLAMRACDLALATDDRAEWVRAVGQLAAVHRRNRAVVQARDALLQTLRRARDWGDDAVTGVALAQLAQHAVTQEQFDTAVEHGWSAVRLLDAGPERTRVLHLLGEALAQLGLLRAALRCYSLAAQGAHTAALRVAAHSGLASVAAQLPDRDLMVSARNAALRELAQTPRLPRAAAHIDLGRAAFQCNEIDDAREHLRHALSLLGPSGPRELALRAEDLLNALERDAAAALSRPAAAEVPEQTRRIAAQLEQAASDSLVTAP